MSEPIDPLNLYFKTLMGESERGKIILLTAKIDDLLDDLLKAFFKPKRPPKKGQSEEDPLLATMRPLSSFSARIETAYRVGLISKEAADCLDLLRKMRNHCAHETEPFTYEQGVDADKFNTFKELTYKVSGMERFLGLVERIDMAQGSPVKDLGFLTLTMVHMLMLQATLKRVLGTGGAVDSFANLGNEKFGFGLGSSAS
jgi:DNA-binding MltR family transcriptional regulator